MRRYSAFAAPDPDIMHRGVLLGLVSRECFEALPSYTPQKKTLRHPTSRHGDIRDIRDDWNNRRAPPEAAPSYRSVTDDLAIFRADLLCPQSLSRSFRFVVLPGGE